MFYLLRLPLPWVLGPLFSCALAKLVFKKTLLWPKWLRSSALIVLGYMLGRTFTRESVSGILGIWPLLLLVSLASLLILLGSSWAMQKAAGLDRATSLFGSLPAGVVQAVAICEDIKGADISVVSLMQVIRVLVVVTVIPFIATRVLAHPSGNGDAIAAPAPVSAHITYRDIALWALYYLIISLLVYLCNKVKFRGNSLIVPLTATAVLALCGLPVPALPSGISLLAQICMGINIGLQIQINNLTAWKKISLTAVISNLITIALFAALDYLITLISPLDYLTMFIGTAPGGITEMGVTALLLGADVTVVSIFQIFRLLFVYIAVIPVLVWYTSRSNRPKCCTRPGPKTK